MKYKLVFFSLLRSMEAGQTGLIGSSATTPTLSPVSPRSLPPPMTPASVAPETAPDLALPMAAPIALAPASR